MFNKSILVALILCACYLGAIQAEIPIASVLTTGVSGVETVQQVVNGAPVVGGGSGKSLPVNVPLIGGGNAGHSPLSL